MVTESYETVIKIHIKPIITHLYLEIEMDTRCITFL